MAVPGNAREAVIRGASQAGFQAGAPTKRERQGYQLLEPSSHGGRLLSLTTPSLGRKPLKILASFDCVEVWILGI